MPFSVIKLAQIGSSSKYWIVILLLLAACGFLQPIGSYTVDFFFYLASLLAIGLGVIHVVILHSFFSSELIAGEKKLLLLTVSIAILSFIIDLILFSFFNYIYIFLSFHLAFPIPLLVYITYNYYVQTHIANFSSWHLPLNDINHSSAHLDLSKTELVKFVLTKNSNDIKQTSFTLDAPSGMNISQVFYNLVREHNKSDSQHAIECFEANGDPTGWHFFVNNRWFPIRKYLDPDTSLQKSKISSNQVIYVSREPR